MRVVGSSLLQSRYSLLWLLKHCYSTWFFQVPSLLLPSQGLLTSVLNFVLIIPFLFFIELSRFVLNDRLLSFAYFEFYVLRQLLF